MLRKHPRIAGQIDEAIQRLFRELVARHMGELGRIPRMRIHEGKGGRLSRRDGSDQVLDPKPVSVEMDWITKEDRARLHPIGLLMKLIEVVNEGAVEMAEDTLKRIFEEVERASQESGNTIDAGEEPLSPELILEGYERTEIDFDPTTGLPRMPQVHVSSDNGEKLREVFKEISETPELRERFIEIVEQSRREWRAREANRKLVR